MNQTLATDHPAHMSLYPTMDSVVEAIQHIEAQVPIMNRNDLFALLMMYQNTLIKEIHSSPCQLIVLPHWLKERQS